ncbi:MAG: DUF3380 domain-containing protein [Deltaproteobacteria bacterium]|jgi:hypothetical protein|nr:DUF3380 domain-containing protein [Deltaproteobacteria bacterium]MBW2481357.1 DUF3380 domain-containing protein [Deltaproteobacteria bacterium]
MPATNSKIKKAKVTASVLNVRPDPSTKRKPIGKLKRGTSVQILDRAGNWYKIKSGDIEGYVSGDYVVVHDHSPVAGFLFERDDLRATPLEPPEEERIGFQPGFTVRQKTVARTWNGQGGLISTLSDFTDIDTSAAVAVLCVESRGKGFGPDGRMIIRFENHIFYRKWGQNNRDKFNTHFRYSSQKAWQNHEFRPNERGRWMGFHGKQDAEWRVFEFAKNLNEPAALQSISMGGPQIMGFNHSTIGYDSAKEMFDAFASDIRYHILGLFDFIRGAGTTSPMIQALQRKNFETFASHYNGPGQASHYGHLIASHFKDFNDMRTVS